MQDGVKKEIILSRQFQREKKDVWPQRPGPSLGREGREEGTSQRGKQTMTNWVH